MVWLCKTGAASAIVTEDSDVFLYCITSGVDTPVLFKLDDSGMVQVRCLAACIAPGATLTLFLLCRRCRDQVCARTARRRVRLPTPALCGDGAPPAAAMKRLTTAVPMCDCSKPVPEEAREPHDRRQARRAHVRPVLRPLGLRLSRLAPEHGHRRTSRYSLCSSLRSTVLRHALVPADRLRSSTCSASAVRQGTCASSASSASSRRRRTGAAP